MLFETDLFAKTIVHFGQNFSFLVCNLQILVVHILLAAGIMNPVDLVVVETRLSYLRYVEINDKHAVIHLESKVKFVCKNIKQVL